MNRTAANKALEQPRRNSAQHCGVSARCSTPRRYGASMQGASAILAVLVSGLFFGSMPGPAHAEANAECPARQLLPELDANYHECNHGFETGSCLKFIHTFERLLPKFDCQRSFDTSPVPAVWLAGDAALEDYVHLLSRLKEPGAQELFASTAFRAILDGALAEQYLPLSRKAERALGKRHAP